MSRLAAILGAILLAAGCAAAREPGPQAGPGRWQLLAPAEAEGGVSTVLISLGGGHWADPEPACGRSHLLEHVAARAVEAQLDSRNLEFGYAVDAFTGPDDVLLAITVGGGGNGVQNVLDAYRGVDLAAAEARFLEEERATIAAEAAGSNGRSPALAPMLSALDEGDRDRLVGNCRRATEAALPRLPALTPLNLAVVSEARRDELAALLDRHVTGEPTPAGTPAPLHEALAPAQGEETAAFFTPPATGDAADEAIVASTAFWILAGEAGGTGPPPRFLPIGRLGYLVTLPRPMSSAALDSLRRELRRPESARRARTALRRGQTIFCSHRQSVGDLVPRAGQLLATDSWARAATFGPICERSPDETWLTRWLEAEHPVPIALATTAAPAVPPALPRPDVRRLRLCGFDSGQLAGFGDYYGELVERLLLGELRFRRGAVLRVDALRQRSGACLGFALAGLTRPVAEVERSLAALAGDQAGLAEAVTAAHRAQCLFVSRERRRAIGDAPCRAAPKARTLAEIGRVLAAGPARWEDD